MRILGNQECNGSLYGPRRVCAHAKAELCLRRAQLPEGTFSNGAAPLLQFLVSLHVYKLI